MWVSSPASTTLFPSDFTTQQDNSNDGWTPRDGGCGAMTPAFSAHLSTHQLATSKTTTRPYDCSHNTLYPTKGRERYSDINKDSQGEEDKKLTVAK